MTWGLLMTDYGNSTLFYVVLLYIRILQEPKLHVN